MIRTLLSAALAAGMSCAVSFAAYAAEGASPANSATAKPDLDKARATATSVCAACHGADGNSVAPVNPSLAGMPPQYVTLQLAHFKAGIRNNPIMQSIAASLSPEDMMALGQYFSQQKPKGLAAKDSALAQAGQKLYRAGDAAAGVPACAACHAPDGAGIPKNYPRLSGQHGEYTLTQLKAFKAGERGNDKEGKDANGRIMGTIAARMNEVQMRALAEYTQGLR
ncbi:MAG: cytochrome c4 [Pseudomonadota bacterium]|nr:cytochrome c4 [Pseudomonadota bacterium]